MQNNESSDCRDWFIEYCRKYHLKITPQRCAIYKNLMQAKNHPTADEMFQIVKQDFPNISYDTVNRTLLTFAEIGLIDVVSTPEGPRRFDPERAQHHHFHCIQCGKIVDFYSDGLENITIPDNIQADCLVFSRRIVLNGLCNKCRKSKERNDRKIAI